MSTKAQNVIVVRVRCEGEMHPIRLLPDGTLQLVGHQRERGAAHDPEIDEAVLVMDGLGAKTRCAEVVRDFEHARRGPPGRVGALVRLPKAIARAAKRGFDAALEEQPDRKRAVHARAKVKELDRRIKLLRTKRRGWMQKARRYEKKGI